MNFGELKLHLANRRRFGAAWLFATGSEAHLKQLQNIARKKGMRLEPDGLHEDANLVAARTEEEIYETLGLTFIEPELREGRGEIALARKRQLPPLISLENICGILHAHTTASDGLHTLQQMAEAVRKRGYTYFGVADHSKSAHYAGGLSLEQIEAQHQAIDELNGRWDGSFRIFKGIEFDILPDGPWTIPKRSYNNSILS